MLRVIKGNKGSLADGAQTVVIELSDADLKTTVGPDGAYGPKWLKLSAAAGTISDIKKLVVRRKDAPDQGPAKIFDLTNGLTAAEFADMMRYDGPGLDLPKLPVFGGIELVFDLTLTGGGGSDTITCLTKGYNAVFGPTGPSGFSGQTGFSHPAGYGGDTFEPGNSPFRQIAQSFPRHPSGSINPGGAIVGSYGGAFSSGGRLGGPF